MKYDKKLFPFTFKKIVRSQETGSSVEKEFECQGTAYISQHTGLPVRTIEWRAKQGYIPNVKRMGAGKNKRIVYFWLTSHADEYIKLVNSGCVQMGKITQIDPSTLGSASNEEVYKVYP